MRRLIHIFRLCSVFALPPVGGALCQGTAQPASSEFDIPYELRLSADGTVLRIAGALSWAVPQTLTATLASAPDVRTIWLESPGGRVQAAEQVAAIIQSRGLDTYVAHSCASACTIVFLAGRKRSLGPAARLGFHRGYAPETAQAAVDAQVGAAYARYALPPEFIRHVLRTPFAQAWYPPRSELEALKIVNAPTPFMALAAQAALAAPTAHEVAGAAPQSAGAAEPGARMPEWR